MIPGLVLLMACVLKDWFFSEAVVFPYHQEELLFVCLVLPLLLTKALSKKLSSYLPYSFAICATFISVDKSWPLAVTLILCTLEAVYGSFSIAISVLIVEVIVVCLSYHGVIHIYSVAAVFVIGMCISEVLRKKDRTIDSILPCVLYFLACSPLIAVIIRGGAGALTIFGSGLGTVGPSRMDPTISEFGVCTVVAACLFSGCTVKQLLYRKPFEETVIANPGVPVVWLTSCIWTLVNPLIDPNNFGYLVTFVGFSIALTLRSDVSTKRAASVRFIKAIRLGACFLAVCLLVAALIGLRAYRMAMTKVRMWRAEHVTTLAQLSVTKGLVDCTIADEDSNFREHRGIDLIAVHRALRKDLRRLSYIQGASTLTQQAARYTFLNGRKELGRKSAEFFYALALEHEFSKDEILKLFFSSANFGYGQVGIESASRFYFHKSPMELDLAQDIFLASAVNKPPESLKQLTKTLEFRSTVAGRVKAFFSNDYLDRDLDVASQEPLEKLFVLSRSKL